MIEKGNISIYISYLFLLYQKGLGFELRSHWLGKDKDDHKTEIYGRLHALRRFFHEQLPFCRKLGKVSRGLLIGLTSCTFRDLMQTLDLPYYAAALVASFLIPA